MSDKAVELIVQSCNKLTRRSYAAVLPKLFLYEAEDVSFDQKVRHYDKECEGAQIIYALLTTKMKGMKYKLFDRLKDLGEFKQKQNLLKQQIGKPESEYVREISCLAQKQNRVKDQRVPEGMRVKGMMEKNRKSGCLQREQTCSELSWNLMWDIEKAAQKKADKNLLRMKILRKLDNMQKNFDEYMAENDTKSIRTQPYFSMSEKYQQTNNQITHRPHKKDYPRNFHSFQFY